jgi:hypothetical protein
VLTPKIGAVSYCKNDPFSKALLKLGKRTSPKPRRRAERSRWSRSGWSLCYARTGRRTPSSTGAWTR